MDFDPSDPATILRVDRELTLARRRGLVRDPAPTPREAVAWGIACGLLSHPTPATSPQGGAEEQQHAKP